MASNVYDNVDRRKYPHRGIITIIADEMGLHRSTVKEMLDTGNPLVQKRYAEILRERKAVIRTYERAVKGSGGAA